MRAQERHHPRPHRDQAATAKLLLIGFALFEQLRVQAQARVDEEHAVIEEPDLHRPYSGIQ